MSSNVQATVSYFYQELQTLLCEDQTLSQGIQFIKEKKFIKILLLCSRHVAEFRSFIEG